MLTAVANPPVLLGTAAAVALCKLLMHKLQCARASNKQGQHGAAGGSTTPAASSTGAALLQLIEGPSLVDLGAFDCSCPQKFYLPDPSFEKLADCYAMVESVRLPLHNQLLAAQAAVLRQLFVSQVEGGSGAGSSGTTKAPVELSSAFLGCTLLQVATFLRFAYSPDHATPASLRAVHLHQPGTLAAVAGLAHRLDAGSLLAKMEAYLQRASAEASISELLGTVQLAETCQFSALADTCLSLLAARLAAAGPFWHEQVSPAQLAQCNSESLASLACKMAATVHAGAFEPPHVHNLQRGGGGAAGGFTWVLNHFSKQQGRITSPWVEVGGIEWRLKVWPRGDDAAGGTHLSAYLECNYAQAQAAGLAAIEAHYEFSFLDQSKEALHYVVDCGKDSFTAQTQNWGKTRMMPQEELTRTDRSYLAGDRLAVRISIRVVPPAVTAAARAALGEGGAPAVNGAAAPVLP